MLEWKRDKRWSDRFIPQIKNILAVHLMPEMPLFGDAHISEAPIEEDQERNTDLIVLTANLFRIGCRIRRHEFAGKYDGEFTIRSSRPSGAITELRKILDGWGDYFFYGFGKPNGEKLERYLLGNLNVFRRWFLEELSTGISPGVERTNHDGTKFHVFKISELPNGFVVCRDGE